MVRRSTLMAALFMFIVLWICLPQPTYAQAVTSTPAQVAAQADVVGTTASGTPLANGIFFPETGALLRGVVDIKGTAQSEWDLSFSYRDNPTDTWFLLAQSKEPVSSGMLASWDSTSVSDGIFVLRLRLLTLNGFQNFAVTVRVGNQLPDETETSTPTPVTFLALTETTTPTQFNLPEVETTPTLLVLPNRLPALPANPAVLNPQDIFFNLGKGVLGVLVVFGFAGFVLFLRRK